MIFDQQVIDGCSRRRPDVRMDFGTHVVIVECDEYQHKGYNCENKRMMEIFQDCGNRPIIFLRFNPDSYENNGIKYKSCFQIANKTGLKVDENEFRKRMTKIVEKINFYFVQAPLKEITIEHYFYSYNITSEP